MLVKLKDVYKIYSEGLESEVRALDGVSLEIERGEFVAVVGQSGSGKSTMMNVLAAWIFPPMASTIWMGPTSGSCLTRSSPTFETSRLGLFFSNTT